MNNQPNFKSQPTNQNISQPTRFKMIFPRLPHVTFWCQTVVMPTVSTSYVQVGTPFVDQKLPGDKLVYDDLLVTVLVDEDLQAWREVHNWLRGMTFPTSFAEYRNLNRLANAIKASNNKPQYSDIHIHVYNNSWNHILTWKFYDGFPIMLGQLQYSATDSPESTMITDLTFSYQWFDVEVVDQSAA